MKYYVADAFADAVFGGNPAGVCLPETWPPDEVMQKIAAENNLPETAFAVKEGDAWGLRWFTPEVEIDLCGHATLGTAYVLARFVEPEATEFAFDTMSGRLAVARKGDLFELDFPSRPPVAADVPAGMEEAVGARVLEAYRSRDLVLVLEDEAAVRNLTPDFAMLARVPDAFAVAVTAKGEKVDFVSRFFAPGAGIPEDPVTGSSHSELIPLWAARLDKRKMIARQLSVRGGTLWCEDKGERIKIAGRAALYLTGEIFAD